MPIKRLEAQAQFPRLGKLRKGDEKPNDRQPGPELTYWRFTSERPEVERAFVDIYGQKPVEVEVLLPHVAIDDNFGVWQEQWGAGSLKHRCDGETCVRWLKPDGTYSDEPKPCPGGCKEVGRLSVILPDLLRAGHVGYVTMETHSINDIVGILGTLQAVADARGREDMRGILFMLRRVPEKISTPTGDGKRVRRQKCMAKLIPAQEWVQAQLEHAQREALPGPSPLLEAPDDDDDDDGVIDGEVIGHGPDWDADLFAAGEDEPDGNGNGDGPDFDDDVPEWIDDYRRWAIKVLENNDIPLGPDEFTAWCVREGHMTPLYQYEHKGAAMTAAMTVGIPAYKKIAA